MKSSVSKSLRIFLLICSFILWSIVVVFSAFPLFQSRIILKFDVLIATIDKSTDWMSFTYYESIKELLDEGNYIVGISIILFIGVLPLINYILSGLKTIGFFQKDIPGIFSKFSMIDVFLIALLLLISYRTEYIAIEPMMGIYLLIASVVLKLVSDLIPAGN